MKTGTITYQGKPCKRGHSGLRYHSTRNCISCSDVRNSKSSVKDIKKKLSQTWRNNPFNKEHIQEYGEKYRTSPKALMWWKDYRQSPQYKKYRNQALVKLGCQLRVRLNGAIKAKNYKTGSAVRDLGCSVEELRVYLASKFQPGMTWENHSQKGWHIDHIKPLSSFDLSVPQQFLEAVHYMNLQPMWASDNLKKSNK